MPDDNQTAAAGLMANQTVTEPRSAVEAASDPSHGGAPIEVFSLAEAQKKISEVVGASSPTIMSGVERIKRAVKGAESLVGEFEGFVVNMVGEVDGAATDVGEFAGSSITQLHRSADAVEEIFARLADLVKRAKAAHG
jgi:hypothetical protein